jgi:hypothetical protein
VWAGVDFTAGLTVGLYIPLVNYARDADCFSYTMATALSFTFYHRYFDDQLNLDAVGGGLMAFIIATDAYGVFRMVTTCTT